MRSIVALLAGLAVAALAAGAAAQELDPVGVWETEKGSAHVQIAPCGEALCGEIVWLKKPLDAEGKPKVDKHNPDPALRDQPLLGLRMVSGLKPTNKPDVWSDGSIYDPDSGKTYHSKLTLTGPDHLSLRGYIGIPLFGRSSEWNRVPPP